ncbi:MAG: hypothetical protein NTU61_05525 [Candidatus Altiarchaeota archaeon]|nr:hypothetical protein [Candidatus Altiarchaeota archaeon]
MDEKKPGRGDRRKRNQQLMIAFVALIMVFSGLYLGFGRENTVPDVAPVNYSGRILEYQVYPIGNVSVPVKVEGVTEDFVVIFSQPGYLNMDVIQSVLDENISSVRESTFESTGAYSFFRFMSLNRSDAMQGVKKVLRSRGYVMYNIYSGSIPGGNVKIIGNDLAVGQYVKALLFQNVRDGLYEVVGFSQGVVPYGQVVRANLTNVTGFVYGGFIDKYVREESLYNASGNVSDLRLNQPLLDIDSANYTVQGNATVYYQLNRTFVEFDGRNMSGMLSNLKSLNVSYRVEFGGVSFTAPLESDYNATKKRLEGVGVLNVSRSVVGFSTVPPEITDGSRILVIPQNREMPTVALEGARVGDEINVSISMMNLGNYTIVFARQV